MRNVRLLALAVAAAVSAFGCGSEIPDTTGNTDPPSPLTVAPTVATLKGGEALRLVASLHLANGSTSSPDQVRWTSADATIASVDPDGTVRALRAGRVQIVATWQESRGSSVIVVADQVAKKPPESGCLALRAAESSIPNKPCD
jgi:Bacterial Ig-like domain (group 2)